MRQKNKTKQNKKKCPLSILSSLSQGYFLVSVAVFVTQVVHIRRHMLFPDTFSDDF